LASFGRRRQPPDARNSLFYNILHHWDFGFVWTLFNPLGSTGQASGIPTLPVVPGLAAVADRAASRLPKSPLTMVSIRHTGSLVRAGDLVFHRIKRFFRAADGTIHPLPERTGPSALRYLGNVMAPNALSEKSIRSSALSVPQPSIHLSWPVALNASCGTSLIRRGSGACRKPVMDMAPFLSAG
jgi:hypothetical protein